MEYKNRAQSTVGRAALNVGLAVAASVATLLSQPVTAAGDRAAFEAAATKCGLPKPGSGRPTTEQEACMTAAGFSRPAGRGGPGHHGSDRPPERPSDASESSSSSSTDGVAQ